jgi:hypothetical protein
VNVADSPVLATGPRSEWAAAFVAAQEDMPHISKSQKAEIPTKSGGKYEYSYAPLPDIIDAVRPILAKHGLAQAQDVVASNGVVVVTTRIYHKAGHAETFGPLHLHAGGDARAAGSAITYARRYALCAALGISPDTDTDAADVPAPAAPDKWVTKLRKRHTDQEIVAAADVVRQRAGFGTEITSIEQVSLVKSSQARAAVEAELKSSEGGVARPAPSSEPSRESA